MSETQAEYTTADLPALLKQQAQEAATLTLLQQLDGLHLPQPAREYTFSPARKWRFDLAWPDLMLAVEVEGGIWSGGRHVRGDGYERDCEKYNAAQLAGWRVLRYSTGMVKSGKAFKQLEQVLGGETWNGS